MTTETDETYEPDLLDEIDGTAERKRKSGTDPLELELKQGGDRLDRVERQPDPLEDHVDPNEDALDRAERESHLDQDIGLELE